MENMMEEVWKWGRSAPGTLTTNGTDARAYAVGYLGGL
jgi:hypothetical protein